ncbi:methyltransferase domain-containing protein [Trichloromonas sp.]|uniref:methyltransferase domain-containing protein n=1 Tax=Trichloromonas sp. TaxID=3069249 RepID=UPI002A37B059|nr:class I SAM-dependent methyltransferase [Desulfuromonadales bacterium]MDY0269050.1 class I SAM-dependent methyltransferase [Trichloromonas sp.]
MHHSSYRHMERLLDQHAAKYVSASIFDLGSFDVNGSYRPLFDRPGWVYRGIDLEAGPNVDIVLRDAYRLPLPVDSADIFLSGQAFEHIPYFWITFLEVARVLKPGGLFFLIAPSRGPEHRYPVDCWRFYPDGYQALARYAGLEVVEAQTDWQPDSAPDSAPWGDTVGVFRKPQQAFWHRALMRLRCRCHRFGLPPFA